MHVNLKKVRYIFSDKIWEIDIDSISRKKALMIKLLRLSHVALRSIYDEQISIRAMSLVYITLLSIVPLLAVSFSVLKGMGVHSKWEIALYYFLEPMGENGVDLSMKVISIVENVNVKVLGSAGVLILIYTAISQVQRLENAMNFIWQVDKSRSFSRRLSNYISVLLISPVIIFAVAGFSASFMSTTFVQGILKIEYIGPVIKMSLRFTPYVLICFAFVFVYLTLPNTKVYFTSALTGGVVAGILWITTGWVFATFVVKSARYSAIYSGFAILILFMIWVYWSYYVLLLGARISFFKQYPFMFYTSHETKLINSHTKEKISLLVMYMIANNFYQAGHPWTIERLARHIRLPVSTVGEIVAIFVNYGLLSPTRDDPPAYLPSKDIEKITLKEVLDAIRLTRGRNYINDSKIISVTNVDNIIAQIDEAIEKTVINKSIKQLVAD